MELFNVHPSADYALETKNKDVRQQSKITVNRPGRHGLPSGFQGVGSYYVPPGYEACFYHTNDDPTDQKQICVNGPDGKNIYDLDPSLLYQYPINEYTLIKNCDHPAMMWDDNCMQIDPNNTKGEICADKNSQCYQNRITYCNKLQSSDSADPKCIAFCMANPGKCDLLMRRYCTDPINSDKVECNCLNSGADDPMCIDSRCIEHGYATKNMIDRQCRSTIDCDTYHDTKDRGVDFVDKNIAQRCDAIGGAPLNSNDLSASRTWLFLIISIIIAGIWLSYTGIIGSVLRTWKFPVGKWSPT
jgi:hypothetical protein